MTNGLVATRQILGDLPAPAQQAVAAAIGNDIPAYRAIASSNGWSLANAENGLTAQFVGGSVSVESGNDQFQMSLQQFGYDGAMQFVSSPKVSAQGNRVDYDYGAIDAWYVNTPAGLEQGFTLPQRPLQDASTPDALLTVALSVDGDYQAAVNSSADGLTLANAGGTTSLSYNGLKAYDAAGRALDASLELEGSTLLIHVNDAAVQYPLTIDPYIQQAMLTGSDSSANDFFGFSVAASGNTMVVGALGAMVNGQGGGAAYIFRRPDATQGYVQVAKLIASDANTTDFGFSVAISGNTVVVGAPLANVYGAIPTSTAYVFVEPAGGWSGTMTEKAKLTATDETSGDRFGFSVAISGDTIAVSSRYAVAEANSCYGAVYLFQKPAQGWSNMTETTKLYAGSCVSNESFGQSVAISGDVVVAGGQASSAMVYLFVKPGSAWPRKMTETALLDTHASQGIYGRSGCNSLAISGDTVVAGVSDAAGQVSYASGAAYVFVKPTSGWTNMGPTATLFPSDPASTGDGFGGSVAIDGHTIVVTAGSYYMPEGDGAAYVFNEPATGWNGTYSCAAALLDPGGGRFDGFGCSAAIVGDTIAIGSYGKQVNDIWRQGAVYIERIDRNQVDLRVTGSASAYSTVAGSGTGNLTYTFTVSNTGPADATGVMLVNSLALEPGVSVVSVVGSAGTTFQGSDGNGTWVVGNLSDGSSAQLTITLTVGASAASGSGLNADCLQVIAADQPLASLASASVTTTVAAQVDLAVSEYDTSPSVVAGSGPGNVTYIFTVTNHGPSDASGVSLSNSMLMETAVSVDSIIASQGTNYQVTGRTGTWTVGSLPVGSSATLTITLTVAAWAYAENNAIDDTVAIVGADQPLVNTGDDRARVTTSVVVVIDPATPMSVLTTTPSLSGGTVADDVRNITIYFSKPALGADNPANIKLYGTGPDGLLGTADDTSMPFYLSAYDRSAYLNLSPPLPEGVYRLALGNAITDAAGHPLQSGDVGGGWTADFTVVPTALFPSSRTYSFASNEFVGPGSIAAADFNGDGLPDLAVADGAWRCQIFVNDGHGGLQFLKALPGIASGVTTADFNRDGKTDLLWGGTIYLGDGQANFTQAGSMQSDYPAYTYAIGDFNHDGFPDVAAPIDDYYGKVDIAYGDGQGGLTTTSIAISDSNPIALAVGDFNGDGTSQFAVASNRFEGSVRVSSNGLNQIATGLYTPVALATGDFNHDGKADLAVLGDSNVVSVLLSQGNGKFGSPILYGNGGYRSDAIITGDFNGDGNLDIAYTVGGQASVNLLLGDGNGGFAQPVEANTDGGCMPLVAADFNGDGRLDLAVALAYCDYDPASGGHVCNLKILENQYSPPVTFVGPNGSSFNVATGTFGVGELVAGGTSGGQNAFNGDGRLFVDGEPFAPSKLSSATSDGGMSLATTSGSIAGLDVSRKITVPNQGLQDFARTVDSFTNPTGSSITATVQIVGNLGSDAATTVFATSNGDNLVEPDDQWIGTDGNGTPAIIHYLHGPLGLKPDSVAVIGDNIQWTYAITVPAGQTVELAYFVIVGATRSDAITAANALIGQNALSGQAAAFLNQDEAVSLSNFQFPSLSVAVTTPSSPQTGDIAIHYTLFDSESSPCSIQVDYSLDDGKTWETAQPASGGDGTSGLASSPSGVEHTFVWANNINWAQIIVAGQPAFKSANVQFRITPSDANGAGPAAMTDVFTVVDVLDTTPPSPNPSTWVTWPHATGTTSISMTATTASDVNLVQYFFHCLTAGGHDSGWQTGATYEDTGLAPNTAYTYQVKTRDQFYTPNEGTYSAAATATTKTSLSVQGTSGNDSFEFFAGANPSAWTLRINGVTQSIPANAGSIEIDGLSGSDTLWFYGASGAVIADIGYEQGTFQFNGSSLVFTNMDYVTVSGASGNDAATLHDSTGADAFQGLPGTAQMTTAGKALTVKNFKSVAAQATQGNDTAVMYGSQATASSYVAGPGGVNFAGAGYNYTAAGFKTVSAYAGLGKANTAVFNSTDGRELLIASYLGAQFIGQGFAYDVWNVPSITGNAGAGDEARFYGSPGGNTNLTVSVDRAVQSEPSFTLTGDHYGKFSSYVYPDGNTSATIVGTAAADRAVTSPLGAQLFGTNLALSAWTYKHINLVGNGGADTADMYGNGGASSFSGNGPTATMTAGGVDRTINNFGTVTAHGTAASSATFFAKQGMTNTFNAGPTQTSMSGNGYNNVALGFGSSTGYAIPGGSDVANYTDSAGTDYFISSYLGSQMFGKSYSNAGWNFATMNATSTGGPDTARFYGSPTSPDSFVAAPGDAKHSGAGYQSEAKNFARVEAFAGLGTGGTAQLTGSTGDDNYVGSPLGVQLWNQNYRLEAWNFASVKTEGNGGNDIANMYGGASNNQLAADNVFAQFSGNGFSNRVDHFATTAIHGSTSGTDSGVLDHAYLETGVKDTPDNALGRTIDRKLWLYDFDQLSTTEKPTQTTQQPAAVDKLMSAFMYE